MIKFIPNLFTLLNLGSGCIGVVFAFNNDLRWVSYMIFISLILDYLDGMAARILNARSPIGKELDSLADLISFGLLPALIAFKLMESNELGLWAYLSFLITILSAYRLAKFNIDERQTENFIGLPTPANALFWSSFPLIIFGEKTGVFQNSISEYLNYSSTIIICIIVFSFFLISEIRMFSLKFKNFSWSNNQARFLFLLGTLILILTLGYFSVPFILILYLIISIAHQKLKTE